ncbi:MAG: DUF58 domain-containing protein [Steroidobacteraceae bacterium]
MRLRLVPTRTAIVLLLAGAAGALAALLFGMTVVLVGTIAGSWMLALLLVMALDAVISARAWRTSSVRLSRQLPAAFAVGTANQVGLTLDSGAGRSWQCRLFDGCDSALESRGLPLELALPAGKRIAATYGVTPSRRGEVRFAPAHVRVRSALGLCELLEPLGGEDLRRVYPDFAQVARYAWLAGDHRLLEIGIKTYQQRGEGTDFKQLIEYRYGDPVRHIDWKATQRLGKPIIREFQDARDQCVMMLIDCGRRMRADERGQAAGRSHFDQVLNAVMLLSYVALKHGDAIGALSFGTTAGRQRWFAPRKGLHAFNALMGEFFDLQPSPTHSDYISAAQDALRRQPRRALVVVITNFRDEDSSELAQALRLLRSRHLVLLASLRERIVRDLMMQPVTSAQAALEVGSAHLYAQARQDAFNRLAARDALMVDAEPQQLGVELVNRYRAAKRAGLI